jgi:hypothetical protein
MAIEMTLEEYERIHDLPSSFISSDVFRGMVPEHQVFLMKYHPWRYYVDKTGIPYRIVGMVGDRILICHPSSTYTYDDKPCTRLQLEYVSTIPADLQHIPEWTSNNLALINALPYTQRDAFFRRNGTPSLMLMAECLRYF